MRHASTDAIYRSVPPAMDGWETSDEMLRIKARRLEGKAKTCVLYANKGDEQLARNLRRMLVDLTLKPNPVYVLLEETHMDPLLDEQLAQAHANSEKLMHELRQIAAGNLPADDNKEENQ